MTKHRTTQQRDADEIDLRIFNAICRADANMKVSQNWRNLAVSLRSARVNVRLEMHPDDREAARY